MAVDADHRLRDIRHILEYAVDELAELGGKRVAHGVSDIHRGGARLYHSFQHPVKEFRIRARRIHGGELNVVEVFFGPRHHGPGQLQNVFLAFLQLVGQVHAGGGEEDVYAAIFSRLYGLPGAVDGLFIGVAERADGGPLQFAGDKAHGLEVALRGDGEPCLDDIHAQRFKLPRDLQLLLHVQAGAGRLFAVPECSIKNEDTFTCHNHTR